MEIVDVRQAIDWQAEHAAQAGALCTARAVRAQLAILDTPTGLARRMKEWPGLMLADAMPLRVAGALHWLALSGADPRLAPVYAGEVTDQALIDELVAAVAAGVGYVVVDSLQEIARLDAVARDRGATVPVMIRLTVGVEAHTHEFIATAHEDQKFGFSITGGPTSDAAEAAQRVLKADALTLVGLHSHIGSQIFDTEGFQVAAHRVVRFLAQLHREHGPDALASVHTLDLGGGFGIAYRPVDDPIDVPGLADELRAIVTRECAAAGLAAPGIAVEPGRAIAGPGTVTVYEVGTLKDVPLTGTARRYVSVDGGMSDNIRTALYDAEYDVRLVSRGSGTDESVLSRVVGKHCESGDIVVRDCWLPADLAAGDLLAVAATGAYCYSMASSYNRLPRPAVVAVRDGVARVILRRETVDDQFRLEVAL